MTRIEQWGAELAMMLRRENDQVQALTATQARIQALQGWITEEPSATLYGLGTGEQPVVPARQLEALVPAPRPLRDSEASTHVLPAVTSCPGGHDQARPCFQPRLHVHTADGAVRLVENL